MSNIRHVTAARGQSLFGQQRLTVCLMLSEDINVPAVFVCNIISSTDLLSDEYHDYHWQDLH